MLMFWFAAYFSLSLLTITAHARPHALHLAFVDGVVTTDLRVHDMDVELDQNSRVAPVRTLTLPIRAGGAHHAVTDAARFREKLTGLIADVSEIENLVVQGAVTIDHLGRASLFPFGSFDFDGGGGAEKYWAPLKGRLTENATVSVFDGHAMAGDAEKANARARRILEFLGARRGSFFGLTDEPDFGGRRITLVDGGMKAETLYPFEIWKILGCDLRLGFGR